MKRILVLILVLIFSGYGKSVSSEGKLRYSSQNLREFSMLRGLLTSKGIKYEYDNNEIVYDDSVWKEVSNAVKEVSEAKYFDIESDQESAFLIELLTKEGIKNSIIKTEDKILALWWPQSEDQANKVRQQYVEFIFLNKRNKK